MPNKTYLDLTGLNHYNTKIQGQFAKKVDAVTGKGLSTEDFTSDEKAKLTGLKNYTLPATTDTTLGGVKVATTENPVPEKTALKADVNGKAFVDWTEAPVASTTTPGLMKLGEGFIVNEDGSVKVDNNGGKAESVEWSGILNKPDLALKSDLSTVYKWKGSVATEAALPATDNSVGDVYNVGATGMNYGWTGNEWDALGQVFEIASITNAEIDALFTIGA